jgi:hypothetical protein
VGEVEALAHYAGQSAGIVTSVQPAGAIIREMAEEAVQASQAVRDALPGRAPTSGPIGGRGRPAVVRR